MNRFTGPLEWLISLAITCILLFALQKILWLVVPFLLAIIIYYIFHPGVKRLVFRGFSRNSAIGITGGGIFFIIILTIIIIIPWAGTRLNNSQESLTKYVEGGNQFLQITLNFFEDRFEILKKGGLSKNTNTTIVEFTSHFSERYLKDIIITVTGWLPSLLLAPIIAFFILRDGGKFKKFVVNSVPNAYFEKTIYLISEVEKTAGSYFQGIMLLIFLDTICLSLGLSAIGINSALLLGFISAVLSLLPFVGSVMGCLMVVLIAATDFSPNPEKAYYAIGVFIFVRLLDDFIFMPMTIGKSLNIHPLITILMIFVGGAIAGVPGMMLVLPLLGVILVVVEIVSNIYREPRLRARHDYSKKLYEDKVRMDLV